MCVQAERRGLVGRACKHEHRVLGRAGVWGQSPGTDECNEEGPSAILNVDDESVSPVGEGVGG